MNDTRIWYVVDERFNKGFTECKSMTQNRCWFEHKGWGLFICPVCGTQAIEDGANSTPPYQLCKGKK